MKFSKRVLSTALAFSLFTGHAWAGITLSNTKKESAGSQSLVYGTFALDSSYPTGGETITPESVGLSRITGFVALGSAGYVFEYDEANNKVLVYQSGAATPAGTISAPTFTGSALNNHSHVNQLRQDEVVSVTGGTGVSAALLHLPVGNIQHVYITAGGVTGAAVQVPVGSVANSKEFSVNYTTGVLQFLVADAVTSIKVTYNDAQTSGETGGTPAGSVSAPTFTGSAIAAAVLTQVPNTTNLSAVTGVPFIILGR